MKIVVVIVVAIAVSLATQCNARSSKSTLSFEEEALAQHNMYRKKHGVPQMKLDPKITRWAQDWANHLAQSDSVILQHRPDNKYGENLFMNSENVKGKDAVDAWYSESKLYTDYNNDPLISGYPEFKDIGHFTQLVWKDSKRLGVAKATSRSGKTYVVANYSPRGNYRGEFVANNVLPPRA